MVHRMDSCQKVKVKTEGDDRAVAGLLGRADKRPRLSGDGDPQVPSCLIPFISSSRLEKLSRDRLPYPFETSL